MALIEFECDQNSTSFISDLNLFFQTLVISHIHNLKIRMIMSKTLLQKFAQLFNHKIKLTRLQHIHHYVPFLLVKKYRRITYGMWNEKFKTHASV